MKVTITYPYTGTRVYSGLTQAEANRLVTHVSKLQETGEVGVVVEVKED